MLLLLGPRMLLLMICFAAVVVVRIRYTWHMRGDGDSTVASVLRKAVLLLLQVQLMALASCMLLLKVMVLMAAAVLLLWVLPGAVQRKSSHTPRPLLV